DLEISDFSAVTAEGQPAGVAFEKLSEPPICIRGDGSAPIIWQSAICRDEIDDSLQLGLVVAVDHDQAHLVVVKATIRNTLYDLSQERVVGDRAERPLLPRERMRRPPRPHGR